MDNLSSRSPIRDGLYGAAWFVSASTRGDPADHRRLAHDPGRKPTRPRPARAGRAGARDLRRLITDAHMLGSAVIPRSPRPGSAPTPPGWWRSPARVRTRAASRSAVSPTRPPRRSIRSAMRSATNVFSSRPNIGWSEAPCGDPFDVPAARPRGGPRGRQRTPSATSCPRTCCSRRARMHARDRADRRERRLPHETPKDA